MPTIGDVAAKARVSTATVSRALNGKASVDPDLAKRVKDAALALGYHPHGPARNLRRRATAVLSLIISDVQDAFFTSVARGVEDVAEAAGYSVVLGDSDDNPGKEQRYLDVALRELTAGVVLCPTGPGTDLSMLLQRGTPIASVGRPLPDPRCDQVLLPTTEDAARATAHLVEAGYRRVCALVGPDSSHAAQDQLAGFRAGLQRHMHNGWTPLAVHTADNTVAAHAAAERLLAGQDAPDAFVAGTSAIALGVVKALVGCGRRLGSDVGVVAFGDAPWMTVVQPSISVITQPAYELGATAARHVLDRIADRSRPSARTVLNTSFLARGSSRTHR